MHVEPPDEGHLLVAIGMGSNAAPVERSPFDLRPPEDARARALEGAMVLLRRRGHAVRAASPLYETQPEGPEAAGHAPFLNACALLEVAATIEDLLQQCEGIEREAGRASKGDDRPRPLDLDLLAAWRSGPAGALEPLSPREDEALVLPHPRLARRAFVLVPLAGVLPDAPLAIPGEAPGTTPWLLLRRLARAGLRGVRPGPPSASFPWRAAPASAGAGC
jgi:2-amino-4-hydroxy-6-hydroxymethyldihydropteridine diphosphokinase